MVSGVNGSRYPRIVIRGYTVTQRGAADLQKAAADLNLQLDATATVYPVLEAGVDWLTVTCESGDTQELFDDAGYRLLQWETSTGAKCKPWHMAGFEGLHCGGVAFGKRESVSIMRLSSTLAWSNWRRIHALATNCSRIDLQVTIRSVPDAHSLIIACHEEALAHVAHYKRPPQIDLRLSNRSSPTVYLNKRSGDRFGRIYDKADESGLDYYKGAVRFEVQFNNDAAWTMSLTLASKDRDPVGVLPYVTRFFHDRGVFPRWSAAAGLQLSCPRKRSNHDRHLEWISRQVRPAVRDLIASGRVVDVINALGLSEIVTITGLGPHGPNTDEEQ